MSVPESLEVQAYVTKKWSAALLERLLSRLGIPTEKEEA